MIITNDFPPTVGGIEGFVSDVCELLDDDVIVMTRQTPGWPDHDRQLSYPVVRQGRLLLPTPAVLRTATKLITEHRITRVIFGAMAPLALLAPGLRASGARQLLAISHGHEIWWATLPGSSTLLRRMGDAVDHVSTISDYAATRIAPALSPRVRERMIRIAPPIDTERFRLPDDHPIASPPTVIAVGRMVHQKGFDTLLRAWAIREIDHARLVLVGDGPRAASLRRLARRLDLRESVSFTGRVPRDRIPELLHRADVFALPVRSRLAGLNPEGLGLGFLEAAASGLPVIAGRSGGAPEAVIDGVTGYVVDPDDPAALASRLDTLLGDPDGAAAMGRAGRGFVADRYGSDVVRAALRKALELHD
ncbi:glycosyltransferase family 4 protein [Microlunatus sp. Gsoil 973]|uniref:glycosyltransferase family 4 protein n=1 Tax=Microlunatus sp. Gsoil 973 TaxID=2672569 RepID=UPI001E2FE61B|nr:glycosyltransferase family 4 protein [Microlunatus sp. Gsoil 973]